MTTGRIGSAGSPGVGPEVTVRLSLLPPPAITVAGCLAPVVGAGSAVPAVVTAGIPPGALQPADRH